MVLNLGFLGKNQSFKTTLMSTNMQYSNISLIRLPIEAYTLFFFSFIRAMEWKMELSAEFLMGMGRMVT